MRFVPWKPGGCFARNVGHWFDNQTHNGRHREGAFGNLLTHYQTNSLCLVRPGGCSSWPIGSTGEHRLHCLSQCPPLLQPPTRPPTTHTTPDPAPPTLFNFGFSNLFKRRPLNSPALCLDGIDGSVQLINTQISVLTQLPVFRRKPLYSETAH